MCADKSRDDDYDSDFDDEEIFKIQMKMRDKAAQEKKVAYVPPNRVRPDHSVLHGIVQKFQHTPGGICILDYVKRGSEINQALRVGDPRYKDTVNCLDKYAKPLSDLIDGSFEYIVLYRNMTTEYEGGKSAGFISTANVPVSGFGVTTRMKVYVPMNVKVLVADITHLVKGPFSSSSSAAATYEKVFEFILPRGTSLLLVGEKDGVGYYMVSSGDDGLDSKIQRQILSDVM